MCSVDGMELFRVNELPTLFWTIANIRYGLSYRVV